MAMVPADLGTAIKNALRAIAIEPVNTYQERLMVAFATEIVNHLKYNADIKSVSVEVQNVQSAVVASITSPPAVVGTASQSAPVTANQNNLGKIE